MLVRSLLFACCAAPLVAQIIANSGFTAKTVTRTGSFHLHGAIDRVFPLFGPVREKEWAPGWEPQVIAPAGQEVAEGMVFTVQNPEGTAYWVITHYDPAAHAISYVNVIPGYVVNRIVITCRAISESETEVTVKYSHTGLDRRGNSFVESQTEPAYAGKMQHWETAINHLLATGKRIEEPGH